MTNLLSDIRLTYQRGRLSMNIPDAGRRSLVGGLQARLAELLEATGGDPRRAGVTHEGDQFAL
jgi:hypothetical protein